MSARGKMLNYLRSLCRNRKAQSGVAASLATAALGYRQGSKRQPQDKDKVSFPSAQESQEPSKTLVEMQDVKENREDILLPNGEINWNSRVIEAEVTGPCNMPFRSLRIFMHEHNISEEKEPDLTPQQKEQFVDLIKDYVGCTVNFPEYYKDGLLDHTAHILEETDPKMAQKQLVQDRDSHTCIFGKDTVLFMSEKDNQTPSTITIPSIPNVEENRYPVFPDGTLNWACTCIEHEVVGPCNLDFRAFRHHLHEIKMLDEAELENDSEHGIELFKRLDKYMACMKQHPVYYRMYAKVLEDDNEEKSDSSAENKS